MFEGEDRYARNDLKDWLDAHGVEGPSSPRPPKRKGGGKEGEEKEGGYAVETGTA